MVSKLISLNKFMQLAEPCLIITSGHNTVGAVTNEGTPLKKEIETH